MSEVLTTFPRFPNRRSATDLSLGVTKQYIHVQTFQPLYDQTTECIANCRDCYTTCVICISQHPGEPMMADCIKTCLDCIATTQASIHLMSATSPLYAQACALCADACERCYNACKDMDNEFCRQCAEACRKCAESCRAMAA